MINLNSETFVKCECEYSCECDFHVSNYLRKKYFIKKL